MPSNNNAALRKAAGIMVRALQRRSPSEKAAASWTIRNTRRGAVEIRSADLGVAATNRNLRHPLFGNRNAWYYTDQRAPARKGWVNRTVDGVARAVENDYAETRINDLLDEYGFKRG